MHLSSIEKGKEYLVRRISPNEDYQKLLNFPRYFEIETVNVCNARCPMCTIHDWERDYKPMTDEVFKKIADEIIQHRDEVKRVSLYRDGEPLIDKKLAQRCATLKEGGVKSVAISSNVSLLNEKRSCELLEAGLDSIIMSIDSLQKEVFESIRVRLKFEEVLANALKFIELRNRIRPQTAITMRMIRQESNQNEWTAYEAFWQRHLSPHDRVCYHNIHNWGGQLAGFKSVQDSLEPHFPCVALWSLCVIFCNGDVPLCSIDYNNKHSSGSVAAHSIAEVWRSQVMNQRRQWHLEGKKSCISMCENCNVWDEPSDIHSVSADFSRASV